MRILKNVVTIVIMIAVIISSNVIIASAADNNVQFVTESGQASVLGFTPSRLKYFAEGERVLVNGYIQCNGTTYAVVETSLGNSHIAVDRLTTEKARYTFTVKECNVHLKLADNAQMYSMPVQTKSPIMFSGGWAKVIGQTNNWYEVSIGNPNNPVSFFIRKDSDNILESKTYSNCMASEFAYQNRVDTVIPAKVQ